MAWSARLVLIGLIFAAAWRIDATAAVLPGPVATHE
jgi:hypothetical protein